MGVVTRKNVYFKMITDFAIFKHDLCQFVAQPQQTQVAYFLLRKKLNS